MRGLQNHLLKTQKQKQIKKCNIEAFTSFSAVYIELHLGWLALLHKFTLVALVIHQIQIK